MLLLEGHIDPLDRITEAFALNLDERLSIFGFNFI